MDATELRALQSPLKKQYRERPDSARVVSRAEGRLGEDVTCTIQRAAEGGSEDGPEGGTAARDEGSVGGLHPATGGDGTKACSADLLLEALVACAGVTLSSVATAMGVTLRDAVVRAEGTWDARGTLGVSKEAPVGLTRIELSFDLDTGADERTRAKLIELTERYCVIYQTLTSPPEVEVQVSPSGES